MEGCCSDGAILRIPQQRQYLLKVDMEGKGHFALTRPAVSTRILVLELIDVAL